MSQCFSANKEEVPDNEQEKGTEKEMAERVHEDGDMVPLTASPFSFTLNCKVSLDVKLFVCYLVGGPGRQRP